MKSHKSVQNVLLIVKMTNKTIHLRLYISGSAPNSVRALKNLNAICETRLPESYRIEVVDLFEYPHRAIEDGVMITPMLITASSPPISIIGDLSDTERVINSLMSAQQ